MVYVQKDSLVEAIQFRGDNAEEVAEFVNKFEKHEASIPLDKSYVVIIERDRMRLDIIDKNKWILKTNHGFSTWSDEGFRREYLSADTCPIPPLASNDWGPPTVDPWLAPPVPEGPRVIKTVESFPKDDHDKVWLDHGDDVWFWSDEAARHSGDERCGWSWMDLKDWEAQKPVFLARTSYAEPVASWFPLKEYVK